MLAVEPAHRQAPAHEAAGVKAAPSPTSHDVFASIFETARAERAQPKQKVPDSKVGPAQPKPAEQPTEAKDAAEPTDTDVDTDKETVAPSEITGQDKPKAKPAEPKHTSEKTNCTDQNGEAQAADVSAVQDVPIETTDVPIVPATGPTPEVQAENSAAEIISQIPSAQPISAQPTTLKNDSESDNSNPPEQTVSQPKVAPVVPQSMLSGDHSDMPNIKTPKPVTLQTDANVPNQLDNANIDATVNHDTPKNESTNRVGLKPAPVVQVKVVELPANEHAKADETTVRTNGVSEQVNNIQNATVKPHEQTPARVQSPIWVEGGGVSGGVDLNAPKSIGELANVLRSASSRGNSSMLLQLDPPELGQVRIDVRLHQQLLTLRIDAQTTAGQQALQSRLGELRSALEQQGLQLGHVSVELRPPTGPEHQFQDTHQQQGWGSHGESHPGGSQNTSSQGQSNAFGQTNLPGEALANELSNESNFLEVGQQRVDMVI